MRSVALGKIPAATPPPVRYGYVDVHRYLAEFRGGRVLLDGVDVTESCRAFDDVAGYVVLYRRQDGWGQPVTYRVDGVVALVPPESK